MTASIFIPVDNTSAADSGSASATVTYDFAPTIDISLSKANVDFNISANEFNKLKTDSLNVTVSTNNITGYTLNMTTDSSATNGATIDGVEITTNALVHTESNKYYVPSITSSITNPTDSTFPVNSWAYSISSTPSNMVYSPLPAAGSSTEIKKVTELDFPTDGSTANVDDVTPVTIATKADMSIPAGTYTNKLVFTAITNFNPEYDAYTIIYNANGGTGEMNSQYATPGEDVTLTANKFARTDYTFLGWSTDQNATSATYTDKQTITNGLSDNAGNVITLYAIWKLKIPANTIVYNANGADGGDMSSVTHTSVSSSTDVTLVPQNYWRTGYGFLGWSENPNAANNLSTATIYGPGETIKSSSTMDEEGMIMYATWIKSAGDMQSWQGCGSMSVGDVTALKDTRDNNVYAVAKLADNKCWTIENLRLSSGTVNSSTTHNPISGFAWTESTNSWCTLGTSACYNQVLINTNNLNSSLAASPTTNNNSSSWYGYGTYYDWYAATAGNGTSEKSSDNVSGDICPFGWHLPTSTSTGEFQAMYTATGGTPANIRKNPNNFVLSGRWSGSSAFNRGSSGFYWSSTANDNNFAYGLYLDSSLVNPSGGYYSKNLGFSVRCIAGTAP